MENKKRKKLSVTEGTGGDHAASIAESGMEVDGTKWTCYKCYRSFTSAEAFWQHSCNQ